MSGTPSIHIRATRDGDLGDLIELVGSVVPECLPETVWQLPWTWPTYVVAELDDGTLAAAGSLQPVDDGRVEIRGLVVGHDFRGLGLASDIVQHLTCLAESQGQETVCVTRKPGFFARLGFRETPSTWMCAERRIHAKAGPSPRVGMFRPIRPIPHLRRVA